MIGAVATHLLLIGGSPIPAVVLLVLSATIVVAHRAQIDALFDERLRPLPRQTAGSR